MFSRCDGWLVGSGLTALLAQKGYNACVLQTDGIVVAYTVLSIVSRCKNHRHCNLLK